VIVKTWYSPENLESWFQVDFIELHACIFEDVITVKKQSQEHDPETLGQATNSLFGPYQLPSMTVSHNLASINFKKTKFLSQTTQLKQLKLSTCQPHLYM
jgi:hypothetical protein